MIDLRDALKETDYLNGEAVEGRVDIERWKDCIEFLDRLELGALAGIMRESLNILTKCLDDLKSEKETE